MTDQAARDAYDEWADGRIAAGETADLSELGEDGNLFLSDDDSMPLMEAVSYREVLHPRNRMGEWIDTPDLSHVHVPRSRTKLAVGYADAARTMGEGYAAKVRRDYANGEQPLRYWIEHALPLLSSDLATINFHAWEHDSGQTFILVSSRDVGREGNKSFPKDEVDAIIEHGRSLADQFASTRVEATRKNMRGIVEANTGENGKRAYKRVKAGVDENENTPRYMALRDRWANIPDSVVLISEKGYGKFNGITDVMTTASRDPTTAVTKVNALAMAIDQKWKDEDHPWRRPRAEKLGPGMDGGSYDSPAALLRHEWAHSLFEEMSDRQRQQFIALLPGWEEIASGLTVYAAGDEETRANYAKRTLKGGYYHETFAESVGLTTGNDFHREQWPEWVGRVADYINELRPEVPQ